MGTICAPSYPIRYVKIRRKMYLPSNQKQISNIVEIFRLYFRNLLLYTRNFYRHV